jgi:hypothetical protein
MSSFCALCPILPVSLDSPFFVLYVFVLCLVPNIACVSGFSILCFVCLRSVPCAQYCLCLWILHSLFCMSSFCVLCPILPVSLDCPFFSASSVFCNVYLSIYFWYSIFLLLYVLCDEQGQHNIYHLRRNLSQFVKIIDILVFLMVLIQLGSLLRYTIITDPLDVFQQNDHAHFYFDNISLRSISHAE